jgi:hypothetical protein
MDSSGLLTVALLQSGAESYLETLSSFTDLQQLQAVLRAGNNHPIKNVDGKGATGLVPSQVSEFFRNFEIVSHYPSDATGFSATVYKERGATGRFVLSIRSTEFAFGPYDGSKVDLGGDWARDGGPGADGRLNSYGFALAQIDSMESLYAHLRAGERWDHVDRTWVKDKRLEALSAGAPIDVTGYSLGGHLATTFALLHENEVGTVYTFNGAGVGGMVGADLTSVAPTGAGIANLLANYRSILALKDGSRQGGAALLSALGIKGALAGHLLFLAERTRSALNLPSASGFSGTVAGNRYSWPLEQSINDAFGYLTRGLFDLGLAQLISKGENLLSASDRAAKGLSTELLKVEGDVPEPAERMS